MCGRTCLTLDPDQIICACKYKTTNLNSNKEKANKPNYFNVETKDEADVKGSVEYITPEWRSEFNCGRNYVPSYNIAPTDITPVIVSVDHFRDGNSTVKTTPQETRIIMPMMWGMIPFWHKGHYKRHGLTTNNCRLEHMLDSKLYRGPFRRGQRCVVLCEGFYEWQTTKSAKPSERAAHLVFMPQEDGIKIYDKTTWTRDNIKLLKMAGLFDIWEDENGDKIYSYSTITFESSNIMSWMHHRMPAILETEEQVNDWLDFKRVTDEEALATLRPATQLKWYQVSNLVNNSRNKSDQCNKPKELAAKPKKPIMNKTMMAWLSRHKKPEARSLSDYEDADDDIVIPSKRPRFQEFKKSKN